MVFNRRARKDEQKLERRRTILEVAREMIAEVPFAQFTMATAAERAGIAKGTIYLYFGTKEHLFLALLEEMLAEWFDDVDARFGEGKADWSADRVAEVVCDSLAGREFLTRLLTLLESVLEHNVDLDTARAFKEMLLDRIVATGAHLERRLPFLEAGEGARLLLHMRALLVGLRQMTDRAPVVEQVVRERREMAVFRLDFEREMRAAVRALVRGYESLAPGGEARHRSADGLQLSPNEHL